MTACRTVETLDRFVRGSLTEGESERVAEHLEHCLSCRERTDRLADNPQLREIFQNGGASSETDRVLSPRLRSHFYAIGEDPIATRPGASPGVNAAGGDEPFPELDLGRFRLLQRLGQGSFGVVYLAEDTQLRRQVALKIPRLPLIADSQARQRFLREAKAAAGLHHPQIVAVYDAGETKGVCYLASAYCDGPTLGCWLRENGPATPDLAAAILLALAQAVAHAHERGVIHRDIKPQNILLDRHDRFQQLPFGPKLTDFSVAKFLDDTEEQTATNAMVGTPRYMSPEQAAGRRNEIGPTSDIFALGIVMYEMLTGRVPFEGRDVAETVRRVLEVDPESPRRLQPLIPADLSAICMVCLEKSPKCRYATATELVEDLQRFLDRRPTRARPIGPCRRLLRWAGRRPAPAALIGVAVVGLLVFVSGLAWHDWQLGDLSTRLQRSNERLEWALEASERAQEQAESSQERTLDLLYAADLRYAARAWNEGDAWQLDTILDRHRPAPGQPDRRGMAWYFLKQAADVQSFELARRETILYYLRLDPSGKFLAFAGKDGVITIAEVDSGKIIGQFPSNQGEVNAVDFSADGIHLASAGDDGTVRIWDWRAAREVLRIDAHKTHVFHARFLPSGESLISSADEPDIYHWDSATGQKLGAFLGHRHSVESIDISKDGTLVFSASADSTSRVWKVDGYQPLHTAHPGFKPRMLVSVVANSDGTWFAAGDRFSLVSIWDVATADLQTQVEQFDSVQAVALSPDDRTLAVGDVAGVITLWQLPPENGGAMPRLASANGLSVLRRWRAHNGVIYSICFSPDGKLLSTGDDGRVIAWDIQADSQFGFHRTGDATDLRLLGFLSDRTLLVSDSENRLCRARLAGTSKSIELHATQMNAANGVIDAATGRLAAKNDDLGIQVWDLGTGNILYDWPMQRVGKGLDLAWISPGHHLVLLNDDRRLRVCDVRDGMTEAEWKLQAGAIGNLTVSPNGNLIAYSQDRSIRIWDWRSNHFQVIEQAHRPSVTDLKFSPDGKTLASTGNDRQISLWDVASLRKLTSMSGHRGDIAQLVFEPHGRGLISIAEDQTLRFWSLSAGTELLELTPLPGATPVALSISQDGLMLACEMSNGCIVALDVRSSESNPPPRSP